MKVTDNRRLANIKTRNETGLEYVMQSMDLNTPFGKKILRSTKPFYPGQEEELRAELNKVEQMMQFVKANKSLVDEIQEIFMCVKETATTIARAGSTILTVVEIYDIKSQLLQMLKLRSIIDGKNFPEDFVLEDTESLLDELDPRHDRIDTFYIYDQFSEKLTELRKEKREYELAIRREQKSKREELRKIHGVNLTPKFDIVVSKSNPEIEKIKAIKDLEITDQDYMSVTFRLVPTEKVFEYVKEMENLVTAIEEEEEVVRRDLSLKIYEYRDILTANCNKIGKLDVAMAKAIYAMLHRCVKPEILEEHVIEIEDGRNLQVEDILKSKNKEYCPVSIKLEQGVTCITGANMGGKTISLKLSGQVPILAQYGFFVPCKSAKIGLSNYMQILIGDSQSVERGLSSFGSEMEELKEIFDNSVDRTLILIDEIASGTNPIEGLALTRSVVDYLIKKPYISLITTHFETVTETAGVVNMQVRGLSSVDFSKLDREIRYANRRDRINIISKYMDYRLCRVDKQGEVPKDALNIAKMLGISTEIIEGAKNYIK